jgi:hypothetical protein
VHPSSIFNQRLSPDAAAGILADLVLDLPAGYLERVYATERIPNLPLVRRELLLLGMYAIDGYIKSAPEVSWQRHSEGVLRAFYFQVTRQAHQGHDSFMSELLPRLQTYNQSLLAIAGSLAGADPTSRVASVSIALGSAFAVIIGDPSDALLQRIGAGAVVALDCGANKLFSAACVR